MKLLDNFFQAILSLFGRGNKNNTVNTSINSPIGGQSSGESNGTSQQSSQDGLQSYQNTDSVSQPASFDRPKPIDGTTGLGPEQGSSSYTGIISTPSPVTPGASSDNPTYYAFPLPSDQPGEVPTPPTYGGFPDTPTYTGFPSQEPTYGGYPLPGDGGVETPPIVPPYGLPSDTPAADPGLPGGPTYEGYPLPERPQAPTDGGDFPTKPGMPGRLPGQTPPITPPKGEVPTYGGFPDGPTYGGFPDTPTYDGFPTYAGFPPTSDYTDFSANSFEVKEDGTYVSITDDQKQSQGGWGSPASDAPADPTNGVISVDNNKDTDPLSIKDGKQPSQS